ncbi:hypothetical protein MBLNU459_g7591t1 [Dothideomycetes sp. NU459]
MDDSACWPPFNGLPPTAPYAGWGFYSPGLICPTGYTTACTGALLGDGSPSVLTSGGTSYDFQFSLTAGETAVGCCPSGYSCASLPDYGWQTCINVAHKTALPAAACSDSSYVSVSSITVPYSNGTSTVSAVTLYAPLIQLNWRSHDVITSTATSTSSSTTTTTTTTSSPTATTSPTPHKGSTAVIIGVIVPVVVVMTAALLFWLWYRRRSFKPVAEKDNDERPRALEDRKEPQASDRLLTELGSDAVYEVYTQPTELNSTDTEVHEMEGSAGNIATRAGSKPKPAQQKP